MNSCRDEGRESRNRSEPWRASEIEFAAAIQDYKKRSGRMFPTWTHDLELAIGLGYRKAT
jgi:hypothetical protein